MARNILVFSPLYTPAIGGLMSHAADWNAAMVERGFQITVFTPLSAAGGLRTEGLDTSIRIFRFPAWEVIPNYHIPQFWRRSFWWQLSRVFSPKPDVIVSRTRFFAISALAAFIAWQRHIPHLHIEHGSGFVHLHNPLIRHLARLYDHTIGAWVLRHAVRVVANSRASADFVRQLSGVSALVIYRGIDERRIARVQPDTSLAQRFLSRVIINYTGRLIDGKGVDDLLHAFHSLISQKLSCALVVVGDGPQRTALEALANDLGISELVYFAGEQSFDQAMSLLKVSDVFVNPSYTEGIPTSIVEAALCRTAIVATDVGGTAEIVTSTAAVFVSPGRVSELSRALRSLLLNSTLRDRLAANAYATVAGRFSWPRCAAQYDDIFRAVL